ncbi:MAG: hypothetical protein HY232_04490 [Acidobacteria bacterium]|nr:hypothetical protein [Acidobacteriota bacterium]
MERSRGTRRACKFFLRPPAILAGLAHCAEACKYVLNKAVATLDARAKRAVEPTKLGQGSDMAVG